VRRATSRCVTRVLLAALLVVAGCTRSGPPPKPPAYAVGPAWQGAKGVWFYPQEQFSLDETGLAAVAGDNHPDETTDHEVFDRNAMAAGHQTLQLPSIVKVTNLENGRSLVVRVNDRGPADPGRVIELTPRAAQLLGIPPQGGTQVRVTELEAESRGLAEHMAPASAPAVPAVPAGDVQQSDLAPPPGTSAAAQSQAIVRAPQAGGLPSLPTVPDRLPETVTQGSPAPGQLMLDGGTFSQLRFAQQRLGNLHITRAHIERTRTGRGETFSVLAGPFADVADADRALDQALAAGVPDARIVVE
jgi:rare lipoprotein A